jgi:hypothetical protein
MKEVKEVDSIRNRIFMFQGNLGATGEDRNAWSFYPPATVWIVE